MTFRGVLVRSHVGAVTIVFLLLGAVGAALQGLSLHAVHAADFVLTAVAIRGLPLISAGDRMEAVIAAIYIYDAAIGIVAAWLLSRWVYGVGPLRALAGYWSIVGQDDGYSAQESTR